MPSSESLERVNYPTQTGLRPYHFSGSWYQIKYLFAAELVNAAVEGEESSRQEQLKAALTQAQETLVAADAVLRIDGQPEHGDRGQPMIDLVSPAFIEFLRHLVQPSTSVLLAGAQVELLRLESKLSVSSRDRVEPGRIVGDALDAIEDRLPPSASRVHYNLACYFARLSYRPVVAEGVPPGDEGDPKSLVERGFLHLAGSLKGLYGDRHDVLASWAWADPTLSQLRSNPTRFASVAGRRASRPGRGGLAAIRIIGEEHARRLSREGVESVSDLAERTRDSAALRELSEALDVSEELVSRWAGIANLIEIPGIALQYANLLDAAGISSPRDLSRRSAPTVARLLADANTALGLVGRTPSEATVAEWIAVAGSAHRQSL